MRILVLCAALSYLLASSGAIAQATPWPGYQIILWQKPPANTLPALRRIGVTAGMILGQRDAPLTAAEASQAEAPLQAAGLGSYIENISTDFYAAYHRWTPDHPVTWQFDQARAAHAAGDLKAFWRTPSLSDPAWRTRIAQRLRDHVHLFGPYHPLFYSLGDETGIADLAAPWDFDLSPVALTRFRTWLRAQYKSLAALNVEWQSSYHDWNAVQPMTTDAAIARTDQNVAAWGDFKAWMDDEFVAAVSVGTAAIHMADPTACAGIEGAQPPGWGGYDYARVAPTIDVMELNDRGTNIQLARAFNPHLTVLTTIDASSGADAIYQIWHDLLLGARGLVIWDAHGDLRGAPGQALAATFATLRGPLGTRLLAAKPYHHPVAILYSQPSFRMRWLLDRRADGKPWTQRTSAAEWDDNNAWRASLGDAESTLTHAGLEPRFVTETMLATGALDRDGIRLLILPQAIALAPATGATIQAFAASGGIVAADSEAGRFDDHGRRLPTPLLPDATLHRVTSFSPTTLAPLWQAAHISSGFHLQHADGTTVSDVTVRRLQQGATIILGLQRDTLPDGTPQRPDDITLTLDTPAWLRDLRQTTPAHRGTQLDLHLDGTVPTLLALSPDP
jgi:hypothetical protein